MSSTTMIPCAIRITAILSPLLALACASGPATPPPAAAIPQAAEEPPVVIAEQPPAPGPPAPADIPPASGSELAMAVVGAPDRQQADRDKDSLRRPAELLTFLDVQPGMLIADLGAGSGYTTELLARAVGADGKVFGQNIRYVLERFVKKSWPARLDKPVMANVVRVDSELDAPLPAQAKDLDMVTMIFFYHDAIAQEVDVAIMNAAIFAALKPGGSFVIADHYARDGSGTAETKTLHRIDPEVVKTQVTAAGFQFVESGDFLRDKSDTRDWKVYERGFKTDRFVFKFRKPASQPGS